MAPGACGDGNGQHHAPTTIAAEPGLSNRRTCGKGTVVYTDVARDSGSLLSPTSLGLAEAKGSSPDRQGTGGSGCCCLRGRGKACSRAERPAEGDKGARARWRGKYRGPRLSPGDEPEEEPRSIGAAAQPLGLEDRKTRDPTLRGCRK